MATTTTTPVTPKVFFHLKDPAWDNLKPQRVHLFGKDYALDCNTELINEVGAEGLEYMRKGMVYDDTYQYFYWTYTPKGSFIDLWATPDLLADTRAFDAFKVWLEATVTAWATANKLPIVVKRDKLLPKPEYILRFEITVTPVTTPAT